MQEKNVCGPKFFCNPRGLLTLEPIAPEAPRTASPPS